MVLNRSGCFLISIVNTRGYIRVRAAAEGENVVGGGGWLAIPLMHKKVGSAQQVEEGC